MTFALSACGGGGQGSSAPVLLPTTTTGQQPQASATQSAPDAHALWPAAGWTGTAGSGFSALPTDPVRQTAKPAMRLIVPPNQAYTDNLLVGVAAFANDGGSMLENQGLKSVVVHYEGNRIEIAEPSYQTFNDANGRAVRYLGWWVCLKHDGRHGDANLFFEAVPRDPNMQNRVMGPYLFMPSQNLHDLEMTVAPSQPEISGSRYCSIRNALAYAAAQGRHRPRITLVEQRNDYALDAIGTRYTTAKGYATIDANVPVTISASQFVPGAPRTGYDGLHFRGRNITINHRNMDTIYHEGRGNQHWFDGVTIMVTGGSGYVNPATRGPKAFAVARNNPWFTESDISGMFNTACGASLVRGCRLSDGLGDALTDARCVIGTLVENFDGCSTWAKEMPAFTVTYTGDGATATLELSDFSDAAKRTFTARVNGGIVGTFEASKSSSTATSCAEVVDWLNRLPGFSAVLQDNTRRATMCSLTKLKGGAFGPTPVKGVALPVVTMFDIHADFWQHLFQGIEENVIVADNVVREFVGQCFFISSPAQARDFVFVNNCFAAKNVYVQYGRKDYLFSQIGRAGRKSHLVFAHNSMTQGWAFRTEDGMEIDRYCLFANNVSPNVVWSGPPSEQMKVTNNHLFAMSAPPAGSTGTTTGGTEAEIWPGEATGDFTPAGTLAASVSQPSLAWDAKGRRRGVADAAGAIAR
ncbi:hypothetical protein [Novosphingobium jiangmenense]|uniref:Uncharacterized protein n=1 Tax=Novosphingobium jiangmenense TaxID=2791981 RepID=A0ABS0HGJ8_9SPHN|nr:hypothetical protein [Novosphingobium jiangmenense]MBF9151380.1 hypothetical protein [Novosphingobium jiangmenense]